VLSAHQGGGEPLRPMPLEITRCLHVLGAELAPPPPPVQRGPGTVWRLNDNFVVLAIEGVLTMLNS
jgi:hypothetical protein